ncbi:MAG: tetratricopeptide repeat protein [Crocinitomicaceae bacterium]|nr:tetratricopeptide repeat protein [Crocinitomicaceae bacterium]
MKNRILFAFLLFTSLSHSCGNEYGHDLNGDRIFTMFFYMSKQHRNFDKTDLRNRLFKAEAKANADTDFQIQSNIALYHMKLGDVKKALQILEPLLQKHPDEYTIAANLGTAYELDGQLEKALIFIKKGQKLNPDSHFKSEWIHIKILEAKIKEKSNPGWLNSHSIITVEEMHSKINPGHHYRGNQLEYQLRTRVAFTPAPNKVMANLLQTLAEYNVEHGTYENAIMAYTYILEFTESDFKKRQISKAIIELNKRRRESGVTELNYQFKRLIESGEIDPTLMLYGIDEVAEELQEIDEAAFITRDSLRIMTAKVDSLSSLNSSPEEKKEQKSKDSGALFGILFGIVGLVLGIVIAIVAMKKGKN